MFYEVSVFLMFFKEALLVSDEVLGTLQEVIMTVVKVLGFFL